MDTLWFCVSAFLILGAVGVIIEHLRFGKWIKDKVMLLIGGMMLLSVILGLIAMCFF